MMTPVRNIGLVGLGPHAERIYYPLLEKYYLRQRLKLVILIELDTNIESVNIFLKNRILKPEQIIFLESNLADQETLNPNLSQRLNHIAEQFKLDGLIIASDPKSHKAYLKWALENNIDILVDKPITCPINAANDLEKAQQIERDFDELKDLYNAADSNFIVQAQRRGHSGYVYIQDYLEQFIKEFQIPISYIDILHSDGMWVMPNEWERRNHSYKYGTGKLMHSGYHFIDLLAWFLEFNQHVKEQQADQLDLFTKSFSPSDFMNQLQAHHYQRFFNQDYSEYFSEQKVKPLSQYGELDIFMMLQLKHCAAVTTTACLTLQQNSFSRRAWSDLPSDIYKGNGRVRHERVNIQVSTLLNIQVHSYQSHQINDKVEINYGPGHIDHFDILIFRNSGIVGGEAFERLEMGRNEAKTSSNLEQNLGHNEKARENLFLDFLNGTRSNSDFLRHTFTNQLMSKIYQCVALERNNQIPYISFQPKSVSGKTNKGKL